MNYADIVTPAEMRRTKAWMKDALKTLRAPQPAGSRAEVRCLRQGWGVFQLGRSMVGDPLCLAERVFKAGFGTHADSEIEVTLSRPGARLTGFAGVDLNWSTRVNATARIIFVVEVEGREVLRTDRRTSLSPATKLDIDLAGARKFTLKTLAPEGLGCAHADWAGLVVTFDDGSSAELGAPPAAASGPLFSFTVDGRPSAEALETWTLSEERPRTRDGVRARRLVWTDPRTALSCALELKEYLDFPVVEWVVRFRNGGDKPSPLLSDILSTDLRFDLAAEPVLHYHDGDYCTPDSYQPHAVKLLPDTRLAFAPEGGRATNRAYPYYNLELAREKRGVILVVGWPGQWSSAFECGATECRIVAGQERTRFRLLPGEEARTPLSVLMFYDGARVRSQNLWRRWMLAHNVPRQGGKVPPPIFSACMGLRQSEAGEKRYIAASVAHGAGYNYWWMDAGWYPTKFNDWPGVGTWEPDPERFPHGIRPVSDYARERGMKLVLWFEPERVTEGSWLDVKHPEWLLTCKEDSNKLLDLGNPGAWRWLVEHIDSFITREGIGLYRQDHNFNPLSHWRAHDAEDRQGITEMRHIEGYLAFWDELRRRHPDMLIDSCASGGRRNDLETLRRSVPLLRSDFTHAQNPAEDANFYATGNQGHTCGLSSWVPYCGTGVSSANTYFARSYFTPALGMGGGDPTGDKVDWPQFKRMQAQWKRIAPLLIGDYYPLTPWSISEDAWIAWQFHRPDLGVGMVQAFRRTQSAWIRAAFRLSGLKPRATYLVTDLDHPGRKRRMSGKALMEEGVEVELSERPSSAIIVYEKAR